VFGFFLFFLFCHHTASAQITAGMPHRWGAVIRKPEAPGSKALPQFMSHVCRDNVVYWKTKGKINNDLTCLYVLWYVRVVDTLDFSKCYGSSLFFKKNKDDPCRCYAATQLALQLQQERAQVVCSNKDPRKRLAQRHSRNGPWTHE